MSVAARREKKALVCGFRPFCPCGLRVPLLPNIQLNILVKLRLYLLEMALLLPYDCKVTVKTERILHIKK